MNEVLADLFGKELIGGLAAVFAELADTRVVSFLRARAQGQELEVIREGF